MSAYKANIEPAEQSYICNDLIEKQWALEAEANSISRENNIRAVEAQGVTGASSTIKSRLQDLIPQAAKAIDAFIEDQRRVRRKSPALKYIKIVDSEVCAAVTLRVILNELASSTAEPRLSSLSTKVAKRIKESVDYALFEEANPGLAATLDRQLARTQSTRHRRAVLRAGMRSADFEGLLWDDKDLAAFGANLIAMIGEVTGLYARQERYFGRKSALYICATDKLLHLLERSEARDALLTPFRFPMVVPPEPWTDMYDGGYLNKEISPLQLVRARRAGTKAQLEAADLTDAMDAVNAVQATPWRINRKVLSVFREAAVGNLSVPGAASAEAPALPEKPWAADETPSEEVLAAWKEKATDAHKARQTWASKRVVQQQQLSMAERFSDDIIYFPHTLDFRGRMYPEAGLGAINPQGNDTGKSLLEFAAGKPIDEEGFEWLLIHAANSFGVDKVSLSDRQLWALFNIEMMRFCAADPIGNQRWLRADKPWAFLAACFEIDGYLSDPQGFLSHLPVSVDGSCSGLQHFAAMLRCQRTAEAVNVVSHGNAPADVYNKVLERVRLQVEDAAATGEPLAREWSTRLRRTTVKQPVMTTPYGVTPSGVIGQIINNTRKAIDKKQAEEFRTATVPEAAKWLAPLVRSAIAEEVSAATQAMSWLEKVAEVSSVDNFPVTWHSPVGFLVIQDYRKTKSRDVAFRWDGARVEIRLSIDTARIWPKKQKSGLAPNFVHSMDAAHLMITVNNAATAGIQDFAMVHDSFGCHASDVPLLGSILRESFIAMYSIDILADLHNQLQKQLPPDVFEKIPPPPPLGSLDLEAVRDSLYFFA